MSTIKTETLSTPSNATVPVDTVVNGTAKAWVNFNGTGTVAIRRAFNVSSITDIGSGDYRINFTTVMPDTNYCVSGAARYNGNNDSPAMRVIGISSGGTSVEDDMRTTAVRVACLYVNGIAEDPIVATVIIFS